MIVLSEAERETGIMQYFKKKVRVVVSILMLLPFASEGRGGLSWNGQTHVFDSSYNDPGKFFAKCPSGMSLNGMLARESCDRVCVCGMGIRRKAIKNDKEILDDFDVGTRGISCLTQKMIQLRGDVRSKQGKKDPRLSGRVRTRTEARRSGIDEQDKMPGLFAFGRHLTDEMDPDDIKINKMSPSGIFSVESENGREMHSINTLRGGGISEEDERRESFRLGEKLGASMEPDILSQITVPQLQKLLSEHGATVDDETAAQVCTVERE